MNDELFDPGARFACSEIIDFSSDGYPIACQRPSMVIAFGLGGFYCADHRPSMADYPSVGPIVSTWAVPEGPVALLEGGGYRVVLDPNLVLWVEAQQGKDALGEIPWAQVLCQGLLHPPHASKRAWRALGAITRQLAIDYLVAQGAIKNG